MTEQTMREIVKSFAYGASTEEVAEIYGISVEDSESFKSNNFLEIEAKKEQLKDGGWYNGKVYN